MFEVSNRTRYCLELPQGGAHPTNDPRSAKRAPSSRLRCFVCTGTVTSVLPMNNDLHAYDDIGSGAPLVFVHGHPFDRRSPQIKSLSKEFRVISADLPGYGAS